MIDFEELESGAFCLIESIDCDSAPHRELVNLFVLRRTFYYYHY